MLNSEFDKNIKEKLENLNLNVSPIESDFGAIVKNLPNESRNKLTNRLLYIIIALLLLFLLSELLNSIKQNNSSNEITNLKQHIDSLYQETTILNNKLNDSSFLLSDYHNDLNSKLKEKLKYEILDSLLTSMIGVKNRIGSNLYTTSNRTKTKSDIVSTINNDIELQKKIVAALINKKEIQLGLSNIIEEQQLKNNKKESGLISLKQIKSIDSNINNTKKIIDSFQNKKTKPDTIFIVNKTQPKLEKSPIPINWTVGLGTGTYLANLETGGSVFQIPIDAYIECHIGSHFSIVSGLEFSYIESEKKPPFNNIDLSKFRNLPFSNFDEVDEFKINLIYLDIPIELRCYILPKKKINPFVSFGIQNRLLFKDQYQFEIIDNNQENYISAGKSVTQLNIGGLKFGTGLRFPVSNRLDGTVRVLYLQGFENLGSINNQLNSVGIGFNLLYKLE